MAKILIVDDNDLVRTTTRTMLQGAGHEVDETGDGNAAVDYVRKTPPDLVLTDLVMPRTSGRQLADILASTRPQMRVLFMSGYTEEAVVRHGVQEANVAFLQKPFDSISLTRKVRLKRPTMIRAP